MSGLMPPLATSASLLTMSLIGKPGGRTQTMWSWCSSWARTMCPSTPSSSLLHCLEQVAVCLLHNTSAFQHEDVLRCCVWAKTKGMCPSHQERVPFAPRACAFCTKSVCFSHQDRVPFSPRACAFHTKSFRTKSVSPLHQERVPYHAVLSTSQKFRSLLSCTIPDSFGVHCSSCRINLNPDHYVKP